MFPKLEKILVTLAAIALIVVIVSQIYIARTVDAEFKVSDTGARAQLYNELQQTRAEATKLREQLEEIVNSK